MPYGTFVNELPTAFFMVVHLSAFLIGAFFAQRALNSGKLFAGWGFALYAVAEVVYMTYHLDWTIFLFAHTVAEVLNLVAYTLIFASIVQWAGISFGQQVSES
ncbi:MAG: hypothetical protein ACRD1H_14825 [Vicinamibacterales bacterium]